MAIARDSEPVISLLDSAVTDNTTLVGAMSLTEARQLETSILELIELAEGRSTLVGAA